MTSAEHRVHAWVSHAPAGVLSVPATLRPGRHRAVERATFSLRRLFYVARHRRL